MPGKGDDERAVSRDKYRDLCRYEKSLPLYAQDWWLDSIAGTDLWDVVIVESDGSVVASLPFVITRKAGMTILTQPPLTQALGPWLKTRATKPETRLAEEKELMLSLIDQLPPHSYYSQNWHYSITNWLPFYWRGYKQTTRYTYVIDELGDLNSVWENFSSSYRNKVRKAEKEVSVRTDLSIERFYDVFVKTFARQGLNPPVCFERLREHDSFLQARSQRAIFSAHDEDDQVHSALYLTWDRSSSYVHMVGEDPLKRKSGAGILLIWEAIKFTSTVLGLKRFDFEGSMIEEVERVRRNCGAEQVQYFSVSKAESRLLYAYQALRGH
jgi:hypothetical protein